MMMAEVALNALTAIDFSQASNRATKLVYFNHAAELTQAAASAEMIAGYSAGSNRLRHTGRGLRAPLAFDVICSVINQHTRLYLS